MVRPAYEIGGTLLGGALGQVAGPAGGLIETSGAVLNLLASINAGRGGMWLIDPYDFTIGATEAAAIVTALNTQNVTISTATSSTTPSTSVTGVSGNGDITINH